MKQVKKILAVAALPLMLTMYSAPSHADAFSDWLCQISQGYLCEKKVDTGTSVSVPEPGTLALLGLGLAAAGVARRKAKK